MSFSVVASTLEVESSKINIGGSSKSVLAILILCFCPPDKFAPFSDINESYLSGSD